MDIIFLILFMYLCVVASIPLKKYPQTPTIETLDFMKKYGYIVEEEDSNSEALFTEEGLSDILKMVQKYGAIPQTGILDNDTLKLMSSRRCGVPDILRHQRNKRYVIGPRGWNKRRITYYVANWSHKLGEHSVVKNIQSALDTWGRYGRLTFLRSSTHDADIIVAFARQHHGDIYPFDGAGGVLAHAFFPNEGLGGDIHFDEDEAWSDKVVIAEEEAGESTDFFAVALHELGHSLGLAHSTKPNSIMFPYYGGNENGDLQLDYDDILGIYELYIRRPIDGDSANVDIMPRTSTEFESSTQFTTTASVTTTVTQNSDLPNTSLETMTENYINTSAQENYYTTSKTDYPVTILYEGDYETVDDHLKHVNRHDLPVYDSPVMPNICGGHFDAVATLREELFVFKDKYVWRLRERTQIERGYPILINELFMGLPNETIKIDAAYERPDGMIVVFTGNKYWVFNGESFIEGSPLPLIYYGLPDSLESIDAVQLWKRNGKTYFYKNDRFWRYNETTKQMDDGYPRHINIWERIPENIDAATTWKDGITYFFKDNLYWTFDNNWVTATDQSPLPAAQWWLGCEEDIEKMEQLYP